MSETNDSKQTTAPAAPAAPAARGRSNPTRELHDLLELTAKYPEIGPPVAALAFKLGENEIAERVVRLGQEIDGPRVEYHFVIAQAARRMGRHLEAIDAVIAGLRAFATTPPESRQEDDGGRLLHLLRLGFSTIMFELEDVRANPGFVEALAEHLPGLAEALGSDPFYRTLLAQTVWFDSPEKSEQEWERAAAMEPSELAWNARGTWYKEAESDLDRAEKAYRQGLEASPTSALLLHNLAQVLIDRAEKQTGDPGLARRLLHEAEEHLRAALRETPSRSRRHVYATRDRLHDLRRSLPRPPRRRPDGDSRDRGRGDEGKDRGPARDSQNRGGRRRGGGRGPRDPNRDGDSRDQGQARDGRGGGDSAGGGGQGQGRGRGRGRGRGPDGGKNRDGDRGGGRGPRRRPAGPGEKFGTQGKFSLGDVLGAKLKEQQTQEPQSKEPQSKEPQSREPQSREPQSREPQSRAPQSREPSSPESAAEKAPNREPSTEGSDTEE